MPLIGPQIMMVETTGVEAFFLEQVKRPQVACINDGSFKQSMKLG